MNMQVFRDLSHEAKVILSMLGGALGVLLSSPDLLTTLLNQPLGVSLPLIIPKLMASSLIGGSLFNMVPKKDGIQ